MTNAETAYDVKKLYPSMSKPSYGRKNAKCSILMKHS